MRRRQWLPACVAAAVAVSLVLGSCTEAPEPAGTPGGPPAASTAGEASPPAEVSPFEDPDTLATVLAAAERALADPATPDADRTAWAHAQQRAYRDLAAHPGWRKAARERIPQRLRKAFDLTLRASVELGAMTTPRTKLPTGWRVLAPAPADELRGYYREARAEFGVPWQVLAAINLVETRFGRIHGDSHAGAQGPMQFMPESWRAFGEGDVNDPRDAILAAGRYLAAHGAPDNLRRALFAYNRSERYVRAVLAHADAMRRYDHYLDVYHRWQVYYRTTDGEVLLREGYGS